MIVIIDAVSRGSRSPLLSERRDKQWTHDSEPLELCNVHENVHQEIENGLTVSDFIGIPRRYALSFFPKKLHEEA